MWLKVKRMKKPLAHTGGEPSSFSDTLEKKQAAAFDFLHQPAPGAQQGSAIGLHEAEESRVPVPSVAPRRHSSGTKTPTSRESSWDTVMRKCPEC